MPALAASFSVGGGTITTTQADNSVDNIGTGGAFELQANTVSSGDTITVSNVNTTALDIGNLLPSTGSYSVAMHGSTLSSYTFLRSTNGTISFDSTGGASNVLSGQVGLNVGVTTASGGVSVKTGADFINGIGGGVGGIAISAVGGGPVTVDTIGATITSAGLYGIVAQSGNADVTVGGLNGGMASNVTANNGYGIYTTSSANVSVTIAPGGSVTALNGIYIGGVNLTVDNFGTLTAANNAIDVGFGQLTATLETGSTTSGRLLGGTTNDTINIVAGANITNATFDGGAGTNTLNLTGSGTASLNLSNVSNVQNLQKNQTGTWTISGAGAFTATTVNAGTLKIGSSNALTSSTSLTVNGGTFDLNGQTLTVGNLSGVGGTIDLGSGGLSTAFAGTSTVASVIAGSGNLTKSGTGTLILTGNNSYQGGTTINAGTLQLGDGSIGGIGKVGFGNVINNGTLAANLGLVSSVLLNNVISGSGNLTKSGVGTLTLGADNTYSGTTTINGGAVIVGNGTSGTLGSGDVVNNGNLYFNRSNTITVANNISGTGGITDNGFGLLILAGSNSYSGQTISNGGSIQIGLGGNAGSLGTGDVVLGGLAQLTINRSGNIAFGGNITGNGGLTIAGSGVTTLTGTSTYTGGTIIAAGTLQIGNGGTSGTLSSGGVVDNGALVFNRSDTFTVTNGISGSGSLTQAGSGTLILNSSNTYSGTTTINSGGTLQVGPGGTNGTVGSGDVIDNGTLNFNHTDNISVSNVVSGSGSLGQIGTGILTLTGANTYTGGTTISAGTLQLGVGGQLPSGGTLTLQSLASISGTFDLNGQSQTIGALSGNGAILLGGGALTINSASSTTYAGSIQGAGTFIFNGPGTLFLAGNAYFMTAPIVINGGALSISGPGSLVGGNDLTLNGGTFSVTRNADLGTLSGTGGTLSMGIMSQITTTSSSNSTFAGVITGGSPAGFTKAGTGMLTLTGNSSFTGPTVIAGGALQIGNGGTSGSLPGNITDNAALVFNRSDALSYGGVISGTGTVAKLGGGVLTLSGTNTYSGATAVTAGTLSVTGSIASSAVSVASGATLNGTGTVGATTVQNGGTLAPGNSIGTLTVNGNLTLASGAIYNVEVSPSAADRTNVTGTASLNGTVAASVASGAYSFGQRFTLINAAGGVSGAFASLTGIPTTLKGQLSYDTNNAYLTLSPNALAPQLTNATGNQHNVVAAIDAAVAAGNVPPAGFTTLYALSGSALNGALDQISGQAAPNVINAVGNSFLSFMSMTANGGSGDIGNFAPGSAYGKADAPHRAQLGAGETRVWGAAYGGHLGLSGDTASGAASLSSNNVGMIGGADMKVADGVLAGVTLGLGRQTFRSGNGTGDSDDFMFGLYGRADVDAAYLAASFGFGWHQIKTLRVVTVSGTDVLQGKQNADDFGGRIEAGWHLPLDDAYTVTPYGAFAGESFESPAYAETALSGASTFALSYAAQTTTLGRSELGAHLDRRYALEQGTLTADLRAAWAHQLDDLPFTQATFLTLPGAAFQVAGVRPDRDTALLGLDLDVQNASGLFFGLHGEGQFGTGTTMVEGLGNLGWRW